MISCSEIERKRAVLSLSIANHRYISQISQQSTHQNNGKAVFSDKVVDQSTQNEDAYRRAQIHQETMLHYKTNLH
jgi:hypothetical protein